MLLNLLTKAADPLNSNHATTPDALPFLIDITTLLGISLLVLCILLCLWRAIRGPHLADRVLASDTLSLAVVGLVIMLTLRLNKETFLDGALLVALLGFAGTIAMAQYIAAKHKHHQDPEEKP